MNWIRIATGIKNDPRIASIAEYLHVEPYAAVGLVVSTLCELPEHARTGDVKEVPNLALERWAGWDGERDAYAYAFRTWMCNDDGVVCSWERHNGAAIREADAARERAKAWRDEKRKTDDKPEANGKRTKNVRRTYASTANAERTPLRDGTGRNKELPTPLRAVGSSGGRAAPTPPFAFAAKLHHDAAVGYWRAHQFPDAFAATLTAMAEGMHGPAVPWETIGFALVEMQGAGARFSPATLRAFVRRLQDTPAGKPLTWDDLMVPTEVRDVA